MQTIIAMAGSGERFTREGYNIPKPLIEVDGKPMIEHVVSMFPGEKDLIFLCDDEHLKNTNMRGILEQIAPEGQIVSINKHKFGPVYSVLAVADLIDDDKPIVMCYCDFYEWWNYEDFKKTVLESGCDAAVTAYKGFHPHLLGQDLYASMLVDKNWMLECREKYSFTENKMDSFQQSGKFYFAKGSVLKKYLREVIDKKLALNGEYYMSIVTQLLVEAGLKVYVYAVDHFLQWGTPNDLKDYERWSSLFRSSKQIAVSSGIETEIFNYWKSFFSKCDWHPYGKGEDLCLK